MRFTETETRGGVATLTLARGKVNALNGEVVSQLRAALEALHADASVRAVVLTGTGAFFSFGFDVPEFLSFSKAEFTAWLEAFTGLYTDLFVYPKPLVAALNGHAVAGGCMLALTADARVMSSGNAKISLNEIGFGSSVLAGSTEMLRFLVGSANATKVLYSGAMLTAAEAKALGLVEEVAAADTVLDRAREVAAELGGKTPSAFANVKALLRRPVAEEMRKREPESIREFVEIWYSEPTWSNLRDIRIR